MFHMVKGVMGPLGCYALVWIFSTLNSEGESFAADRETAWVL